MPASSTTLRTAFPAMIPVPGEAGIKRTLDEQKAASTWWGIVVPSRVTRIRFLRPSLTDFSTALGTSLALP